MVAPLPFEKLDIVERINSNVIPNYHDSALDNL